MKRCGMTGMVNVLYAFALVLMLLMTLALIGPALFRKQDPVQTLFESDVYTVSASLEAAKLYMDTAAVYSLRQAMYENGMRGGFSPLSRCEEYEYGGKDYCLWSDGSDVSPSEENVISELEITANYTFFPYVNGSVVVALYPVAIPRYAYPVIRDASGYDASMLMEGKSPLSLRLVSETSGGETALRVPSSVNVTAGVPYFRMLSIAKGIHESLSTTEGCSAADVGKSETTECCTVSVKVVQQDGCVILVDIRTKDRVLVWDGKKASMEPIALAFIEKGTGFAAGGESG